MSEGRLRRTLRRRRRRRRRRCTLAIQNKTSQVKSIVPSEPVPVKRHRGEPGLTRTRGRTKAHGPHRRTSQPSKPTNNTQPAYQHVSATTEAAADSRAAGPESTAPRGRLRRGHPQRTRPCLHPLPERLPAPVPVLYSLFSATPFTFSL
jgi:hypothetical protein